jgi:hypothetical protein
VENEEEDLEALGWRQGSVLASGTAAAALADAPAKLQVSEGAQLVVISHDCDVTSPDWEKEPEVELVIMRPVEGEVPDGAYMYGKNPRIFHLPVLHAGSHSYHEVLVNERFQAPRTVLIGSRPDSDFEIEQEVKEDLGRWVGKRYNRVAFPTLFNERTAVIASKVHAMLKKKGHHLSGIYIGVVSEDVAGEEPYEILVIGSMRRETYSNQTYRAKAQEAIDQIGALLDGLELVEVLETELRPEASISLDDLRYIRRWDFDDLSVRQTPHGDISPA